MADMRNLEFQGKSWRYISKRKGVRIHRKLDTDSLTTARRMRDDFERTGMWENVDSIIKEGLAARAAGDGRYMARVEELASKGEVEKADLLRDVARGKTPIDTALRKWHGSRKGAMLKDRTRADHQTAVDRLDTWLGAQGIGRYIEIVTPDHAEDYARHLESTGTHPRTANKHLNSLRSLWTQAKASPNPWSGVSLDESTVVQRERPFSDHEVRALLTGDCDPEMRLVIVLGLVTGARLDELFRLKGADIRDGVAYIFNSKRKGAPTQRPVPLHDSVRATIEVRAKAVGTDGYLFEGKDTGWDGARSMAFSKRFATYRVNCDVDDTPEGQRRSAVNYHSARRWFVTQLEGAGVEWTVIQRLIGHKIGNLAGDVYSGGGNLRVMREAIAKIELPA